MNPTLLVPDSPAAMLAAVACVIAGGPWFADGVRALRRRRALRSLEGRAGLRLRDGAVVTHGVVGLESPLFAPLSARPCAGFVLEVRSPHFTMAGRVRESRAFRLATPDGVAVVDAPAAEWDLRATSERTFGSPSELSENLLGLLSRTAETRWLLARGGELVMTERALFAGAEAGVLGSARRTFVAAEAAELARTGTDDVSGPAEAAETVPTSWTIGASDALETFVVSDRDPSPASLAPPAWRTAGAALGPVLALAGMLELAQVAGRAGLGGN